MYDWLTPILAIFAVASSLGTASALFYGVRNKTIITTLRESNDAYKERNSQQQDQINDLTLKVNELNSKVETLIKLKTPDLTDITKHMDANHLKLVRILEKK